MDVQAISTIVGSFGFPIACCIYLLYNQNKRDDKLLEIVQNNTKVMTKLCSKLGVDSDD